MNSDLSKVQVGDHIWTIRCGWCRVAYAQEGMPYPIVCDDGRAYTIYGKFHFEDRHPSAFTEPPACFNPEPKPCRFTKGQRVLVRDYDNITWRRRYFAEENPYQPQERFGTFVDGTDEWSSGGRVRYWKYCKPWKEGEEE